MGIGEVRTVESRALGVDVDNLKARQNLSLQQVVHMNSGEEYRNKRETYWDGMLSFVKFCYSTKFEAIVNI